MISIEEARTRLLAKLRPTPAEMVPLAEAWRRVSAATDPFARLTQPPQRCLGDGRLRPAQRRRRALGARLDGDRQRAGRTSLEGTA